MSWRVSISKAPRPLTRLDVATDLVVLSTFALAQPLLYLLGRNPEFFLARAAPPIDVYLVAVVGLIFLPGIAIGVALGAGLLGHRALAALHAALVVTFGAALVVQVLDQVSLITLPGWLAVALAAAGGGGIWLALRHWSVARTLARWLTVGPVVFGISFLLVSPTAQLLAASGDLSRPQGVVVANPVPVVVVVFDEFPLASLIDGEGRLLVGQYPNLGRLAADGVWYRNAVGVLQQTEEALPTILSGQRAQPDERIPFAADYPLTIFSLLSDTYEIRASESVTELCPRYACVNSSRAVDPAPERWRALAGDLSIVEAHLLFPDDLSSRLPVISQTWGDFARDDAEARGEFDIIERFRRNVDADRRVQVDGFIDVIEEPTDEPTLYFAHLLYPHLPWNYLPDGRAYRSASPAPGSNATGWGGDEWLVTQANQRQLLQVAYADTIVGRIVSALEARGVYEETLVVVMADHGSADIPGVEHRRTITPETVGHIAAIPLFVKLPGDEGGTIDDYRAETIDVLPTIADVLGIAMPWEVDGTSLLAETRPERTSSTMTGPSGEVTFGVDGHEVRAVAKEKMARFEDGDPWRLAPPGYAALLGGAVWDLDVAAGAAVSVRLDRPADYVDLDPAADPFPALLTGRVTFSAAATGEEILAVAVDGVVRGVTRTFDPEERDARFQVMLPPAAFTTPAPHIEVLVVGEGASPFPARS